jgi:hypothetical protein
MTEARVLKTTPVIFGRIVGQDGRGVAGRTNAAFTADHRVRLRRDRESGPCHSGPNAGSQKIAPMHQHVLSGVGGLNPSR